MQNEHRSKRVAVVRYGLRWLRHWCREAVWLRGEAEIGRVERRLLRQWLSDPARAVSPRIPAKEAE